MTCVLHAIELASWAKVLSKSEVGVHGDGETKLDSELRDAQLQAHGEDGVTGCVRAAGLPTGTRGPICRQLYTQDIKIHSTSIQTEIRELAYCYLSFGSVAYCYLSFEAASIFKSGSKPNSSPREKSSAEILPPYTPRTLGSLAWSRPKSVGLSSLLLIVQGALRKSTAIFHFATATDGRASPAFRPG